MYASDKKVSVSFSDEPPVSVREAATRSHIWSFMTSEEISDWQSSRDGEILILTATNMVNILDNIR